MVDNFVYGDSVTTKINDDVGHYFQTKMGLCQGDPFSSMPFNIETTFRIF